jgi:argininosuccinate synthase
VEAALETGAGAVCHGATGKGNDYLRFEQRIKILAPGMAIISPWREWSFEGRDDANELVRTAGVSLPTKAFDYSIDANLMHRSYEGGVLEDLQQPLPEFFQEAMTRPGQLDLEIGFAGGLPCSVNGENLDPLALMQVLNAAVSQTGYGWLDLVETRTNGLKSRGIYHTPAGSVLHLVRTTLNRCWFPKPVLEALDEMGRKVGVLVYQGIWQHPLQMAYQAAAGELYGETKGSVSVRLNGAQALIQSRVASPNLFQQALGGFGNMSQWPSQFSEALVFFQHLQHHSQLPGVSVKELCN